MDPIFKGALIGFSIAASVGPVGLLCIRRALTDGRLVGFVSGLGAATADTLYGLVAAFSLTALTDLLIEHRATFQLLGGIFLLYLGIQTLRARPPTSAAERSAPNLLAAYLSTFALTLTSPVTILAFVGIFAGLGLGAATGTAFTTLRLILGVFAGSAAWWLILSSSASLLGRKLQSGGLRTLNLISGTVILAFGLWQLAQLARSAK
ncbi:MAG: LysE family transporter [Undibacterium sp.]|nr:LysE family transporter [Opitutaceae bacterium]